MEQYIIGLGYEKPCMIAYYDIIIVKVPFLSRYKILEFDGAEILISEYEMEIAGLVEEE